MPTMTDALDFHAKALTLRAERQRILASNIANADTPGYQARDMDFAATLRAAVRDPLQGQQTPAASGRQQPYTPVGVAATLVADRGAAGRSGAAVSGALAEAGGPLPTVALAGATEDASRAGWYRMPAIGELGEPPELQYARYSQDSVDRNTVDMDRERATFADNSVRYEATLRFINSGVRSMLDAMKSHNQA